VVGDDDDGVVDVVVVVAVVLIVVVLGVPHVALVIVSMRPPAFVAAAAAAAVVVRVATELNNLGRALDPWSGTKSGRSTTLLFRTLVGGGRHCAVRRRTVTTHPFLVVTTYSTVLVNGLCS
jgi:hypothetical protein